MQPKSSDFGYKNRDCLTLVVRQSLLYRIERCSKGLRIGFNNHSILFRYTLILNG